MPLLKKLARALAGQQLWAQADAIWVRIEAMISPTDLAGLRLLGIDLAESGCEKRAEAVGQKLEALAQGDEDREALSMAGVRVQQWEQAIAIASAVADWVERARALREVRIVLSIERRWEQATAVAQSLDLWEERAQALGVPGQKLAQGHRWEQWAQAEQSACSLRDDWAQGRVMRSTMPGRWRAEVDRIFSFHQQEERAALLWVEAERVSASIEELPKGPGRRRCSRRQACEGKPKGWYTRFR